VVAVAADLVVVTVDLAVAEDSSGRSERSLMMNGPGFRTTIEHPLRRTRVL